MLVVVLVQPPELHVEVVIIVCVVPDEVLSVDVSVEEELKTPQATSAYPVPTSIPIIMMTRIIMVPMLGFPLPGNST